MLYQTNDIITVCFCCSEFHLAKARETYGMNNAYSYPKEVRWAGRPTSRVTPIYEKQKAKGANFSISAGIIIRLFVYWGF